MRDKERPATQAVRLERRRYGRATYCWAYVDTPDGISIALGDPWPGINWPRDVLDPLVRAALAHHAGDLDEAKIADAEAIQAQLRRLTGIDRLTTIRDRGKASPKSTSHEGVG